MDQDTIELALKVIGIASIIAAITPTPKDDIILGALRQILNILASNIGQAKPEKKPPLPHLRKKKGPRG